MANTQGKPPAGEWSSGLFDCFDDISGCCLTVFCPCVTFGRIAAIVDEGATSCCVSGTLYLLLSAWTGGQPSVLTGGLSCLYSCCYRSRLRAQYGLAEGPCNCPDCCVHFWCEPCALCQEYRELKARGFDMSEGWERNMERMGKAGGAATPRRRCIRGCRVRATDAASSSWGHIRSVQGQQLPACIPPTSIFVACLFRRPMYSIGVLIIIVRNHYLQIHASFLSFFFTKDNKVCLFMWTTFHFFSTMYIIVICEDRISRQNKSANSSILLYPNTACGSLTESHSSSHTHHDGPKHATFLGPAHHNRTATDSIPHEPVARKKSSAAAASVARHVFNFSRLASEALIG